MKLLQMVSNCQVVTNCIMATNCRQWRGDFLGDYRWYATPLEDLEVGGRLNSSYGRLANPLDSILMHWSYYKNLEGNYCQAPTVELV
jgi:hypothetical protein